MEPRVWQRGYGFSPRHKKIAREIVGRTLVEVGESPERTRVAVAVGAPITVRENDRLCNLQEN